MSKVGHFHLKLGELLKECPKNKHKYVIKMLLLSLVNKGHNKIIDYSERYEVNKVTQLHVTQAS